MHALILAAGIGNRLGDAVNHRPKCLLEFAGKSLLERHLDILSANGIREVTIVTGYLEESIRKSLSDIDTGNIKVRTIRNDDYLEGSVVSLWTGREILNSGNPVLLMDADVLYSGKLMQRLVNSSCENCFLLDRDFEAGDEPVKLCIKNGQIIEFRKIIDHTVEYELQGESVGFFKFSPDVCRLLIDAASGYISGGRRNQPYEEVIRDIILARGDLFGYEDITGIPWIEIDFPEDIDRARHEILPAIDNCR